MYQLSQGSPGPMGDSGAGARVWGVWGGGAVGDSVGGYGACTARPGVKNLRPLRRSQQIKIAVWIKAIRNVACKKSDPLTDVSHVSHLSLLSVPWHCCQGPPDEWGDLGGTNVRCYCQVLCFTQN